MATTGYEEEEKRRRTQISTWKVQKNTENIPLIEEGVALDIYVMVWVRSHMHYIIIE